MYRYIFFLIMFFTVIFITGCRAPEPKLISEDNIILTKDGLNDYYSKIFTEFRNAKGKDREKYEDIFLYFFSQFRIVDLQKDYHKNPCLITKKAVIALMGEPDSINEFNPNRYRYITLKDNGRTYYITIIFKDNLFDDITFGSFIK